MGCKCFDLKTGFKSETQTKKKLILDEICLLCRMHLSHAQRLGKGQQDSLGKICEGLNSKCSKVSNVWNHYSIHQQRYDGGVSQHFEMESHGGTTFCALAALQLSDQIHLLSPRQVEKMKRWLLFRQDGGFQGRPNKPIDTW